MTADDARLLVIGSIVTMCIQRGSAHLQPDMWGWRDASDSLSNDFRRLDSGLQDLRPVSAAVSTIHTPSSQVDDRVRASQFVHPCTQRLAIPINRLPWKNFLGFSVSAEGNYLMTVLEESVGQNSSNMT